MPADPGAPPVQDALALLALLDSAAGKAEAAAAVLQDRRCRPVDCVPLLHLGWSRALVVRAALEPGSVTDVAAFAGNASSVVPGCRPSRVALALSTLAAVERAHAEQAVTDVTEGLPSRRELLWLAFQLRSTVSALRRSLHLRADLPRPFPLRAAGSVLASAAVGVGLWFAATSGPVLGARAGWRATYYRGEALSGPTVERTETELSFDWGHGPPMDGFPSDKWSVRYEGCLPVDSAGEAVFVLSSDDGSRLYVDGKLVVDNWGLHGMVTKEGKVQLEAGMRRLRVEYMEGAGGSIFIARMGMHGASPVIFGAPRVLLPSGTADDGPVCGSGR